MGNQETEPIRVVVVEDQADIRELLRTNLELDERYAFAGEAPDGERGIEVVLDVRPDVVILDLSMPNVDGLGVLERLRTDLPETKVVVFSARYDRYDADTLLEHRAHLYLDKSRPLPEAFDEIERVARPRG